ncbi:MAG: glucosaminidase domain-containing protein [Bacteroidota bacterium]|nr:glucosaminidase domain-containing protein [Bacteroidota bacterium]
MKKILNTLTVLFLVSLCLTAQKRQPDYEAYIKKYQTIAITEQKKYGIPASITLAQGLLESRAGKSPLATEANNHFGIKCSDWRGDTFFQDDDQKNECFRKYSNPKESYEDHSSFLAKRSRYAPLFSLKSDDYKGWANGLQSTGYATSKTYASSLINLIELYQLNMLDSENSKLLASNKKKKKAVIEEKTIAEALAESSSVVSSDFGVIEEPFDHKVYKNNGVKYVLAKPGDTYKSIAREVNLPEKVLRYKNEVTDDYALSVNEVVYLGTKKSKAAKNVPATHRVEAGESMHSISQTYGIKVKKLYQLNDITYGSPAVFGKVLNLK